MKKNEFLIVLIILLFLQAKYTNIIAQYTTNPQGIMVDVGSQKLELAVAKTVAFRLSIANSGTPTVIPSIFIDYSDTTQAAFTIISNAPSFGIQTSYGKLMINTSTKKWSLYDADGNALIPYGTFSTSDTLQNFNDGPKSSGTFYGSGNIADGLIRTSSWSGMYNGLSDIPYFWSTAGYCALAITTNDDIPAEWESNGTSTADWKFIGKSADLYVWPAKTLYDAMKSYIGLTGKPKIPPKWAFGYLQSRWGWTDRSYIETTLDSFRMGKFPVDAFIYDFEWYTDTPDYDLGEDGEADFSDFGFNPILFSEPSSQIAEYQNRGIKFIGIRKPRLGNTANLDLAISKGWIVNSGFGNRGIDFRIDSARLWYASQTEPLLDAGVDAWWNDEGEKYYTCYYWWNKAQTDLRDSVRPNDRHFSINRAFSPGSQRMGYCTWTGDITPRWEDLLLTPQSLLNWSLAGMYYGSCDIGGFAGSNLTSELLTRWFEAGVFFPIMRAHSSYGQIPHFPWLWGNDAEAAIRKSLNLRYQLIPYIYSLGHEAYITGAPIMRPLVMEFPDDTQVSNTTNEWLLGKGILAAPILNAGGRRSIYFPDDLWYEFETNATLQGPKTISVSKPLDEIPVFVRAGTILPIGPVIQYTGQDTTAPLDIHIYPGRDAVFTLYEDDGKTYNYIKDSVRTTTYTWTDNTNTLSWQVQGDYSGTNVFTSIRGFLGTQEKTATLGTEGSLVFDPFDFPIYTSIANKYSSPQMLVNLYPNPAHELVNVDLYSIGTDEVSLSISDLQGKFVYECMTYGGNIFKLNVSDLQGGVYFVNIRGPKVNINQKLVIVR